MRDETEVSNVVYVNILSEVAESKSTLVNIIGNIHKTFVRELGQKWVIIVGDAKIYDVICALRMDYGKHLDWLIPFPGDWHTLWNYQKVLMKVYSDAGLVQLAKEAGHRAETLTTLIQCSNFKRTHNFLLQAYTAFYQFFLQLYYKKQEQVSVQELTSVLQDLLAKFSAMTSDEMIADFRSQVKDVFSYRASPSYASFTSFMESLSQQQSTIKFWFQFIMIDCFAYIALYIALRYRMWDLRVGSLKLMAPIFHAFDRPIYQRLVPRHLKDLALLPEVFVLHQQTGMG